MANGLTKAEEERLSRKARASGKKYFEKICFNKKFREKSKKLFLSVQESCIKDLETFSAPKTLKDLERRSIIERFLDTCGLYLRIFDEAERSARKNKISDGKFSLLAKGKKVVFTASYYKGQVKIKKFGYFLLPDGLPSKKTQKTAMVVREKINDKGFKEIDRGTFTQVQKGYNVSYLTFKGKETHKYKIRRKRKQQDVLWILKV